MNANPSISRPDVPIKLTKDESIVLQLLKIGTIIAPYCGHRWTAPLDHLSEINFINFAEGRYHLTPAGRDALAAVQS